MQPTRRGVMKALSGAVVAGLAVRPLAASAALQVGGGASPQPMSSPNAPSNRNAPLGVNGADIPVRNGGQTIPPATWLEIKSDAQKMLDMATDFKAQIDRTNLTATLSLPLIQEAHKMEKLAKQIQSRMKQ